MPVLILTHPLSHQHVTPPGHPECVARIEAVDAVLARDPYAGQIHREAPAAGRDQIARAHDEHYMAMLEGRVPEHGFAPLDADTFMSPRSLEAARHAAGGAIAAVEAVMAGETAAAFCALRPCGHHAETDKAMGFCFYNNVAVAALHALDGLGLSRVAVVDFDVHHGNGTQDIFWADQRVLFASTHQHPLYPGTGGAHETGLGNILNVPLAPMTGGEAMRRAYESQILPAIDAHRPELILVSAGFDAHRDDPLANLEWTAEDFAWATERLADAALRHCGGRIVSALEGGYDLDALAGGVAAHLDVLIAHAERVASGATTGAL